MNNYRIHKMLATWLRVAVSLLSEYAVTAAAAGGKGGGAEGKCKSSVKARDLIQTSATFHQQSWQPEVSSESDKPHCNHGTSIYQKHPVHVGVGGRDASNGCGPRA